jgi:hypothetical protein
MPCGRVHYSIVGTPLRMINKVLTYLAISRYSGGVGSPS